MALEKLANIFTGTRGKLAAAALSAAAMVSTFSGAAQADDANVQQAATCSSLFQTSTGREVNASYSAHVYSQENVGSVGISIFPGADLGDQSPHKLGTFLAAVMNKYGVDAKCFVHNTAGPNGTSVQFHITGLSWKKDGYLNISQSLDKATLRGVIDEAKTARALLAQAPKDGLALAH